MENVFDLIERLEDCFAKARTAMFSKKVAVDADECLELLARIKESLPATIREAERLVGQSENMIGNAESKAQRSVREAEMRAEQIISESELLRRAEEESEAIRAEARQFNDTIKKNARIYVDNLFEDVEKFLGDSIATVRNNREELRGSLIKDKK